ncbi:superoxide dismutase family protein [Rhodococcus rhodnii]|nr:superoxide dismutase family protein [Rhodococcus rhodnii]TXG92925.1 superoxide dismutase family protein [Rhodococcus rhodnii]
MFPSPTSRKSVRYITPLVALAAVALTGCSNNEEAASEPGTTPPVWTGSAAPEGGEHGGHAGTGAGTGGASGESLTATLEDPQGTEIGTVTFTDAGEFVQVSAEVEGLEAGFHGFHVHQVGVCEANSAPPNGGAPGNFLSAGGHLHSEGDEGHPAAGDLTSIQVREDGVGELVTTTSGLTLDDLRADGGRAVIVHEGADNFANIPTRYAPGGPDEETLSTGDAGARAACGVVGAS